MKALQVKLDSGEDVIIYDCPYCQGNIITYLSEINCRIFRHGFDIITNQQMNPHASESECKKILEENKNMQGCGGQYEIMPDYEIIPVTGK